MSTTFKDEAEFEATLVKVLTENKGWNDGVLYYPTEQDLLDNWAEILYQSNREQDRLNGCRLTDTEMRQVINKVNMLHTPAERNRLINGRSISIMRDNPEDAQNCGKTVSLRIYDRQQIAGGQSRYQLAVQPKFRAKKDILPDRRGDVMLLINGMPLIHIELKRSGVDVSQAIWQIEKYAHEGVFDAGILSLVQVFVAMTPTETLYFANPGTQNLTAQGHFKREFMFYWADENNVAQNDWPDIAEHLLSIPMAHKMIGFYTVADAGDGVLKVMRSYQYYAATAISDAVSGAQWGILHPLGGYVAHTTGSGKTMTSYKSAQLISASGDVDKVVFLVDRVELGVQSLKAYRDFATGYETVNETEDTDELVRLLTSDYATDALIVTSIQKISNIDGDFKFASPDQVRHINEKKVVFIIDECHRDTFGKMMSNIKEMFPYALLFGFTGTPIFDENKKELMTTADIFGNRLHLYSIGDGIRDGNVLGFDPVQVRVYPDDKLREAVALEKAKASDVKEAMAYPKKRKVFLHYMNETPMASTHKRDGDAKDETGIEDLLPAAQWEGKKWRQEVVSDIVGKWDITSVGGMFHAIFATRSRMDAIKYYRLLRDSMPDQHICLLVTPEIPNDERAMFIEKGLMESLEDYEGMFHQPFKLADYADYKNDLSARLAHKEPYIGIDNDHDRQIDILVVVDQMLTGFDSKWINTLYLDRVLEYEKVIQAFSRTNRLFGSDVKPFGTIRYYRKPHTMARNIERAVSLYSGERPAEPFVQKLGNNIEDMNALYREIGLLFKRAKVEGFATLPESEEERAQFAKLFKQLSMKLNAARVQGFTWRRLTYGADEAGVDHDVTLDFDETTYLVLAQRYKDLFKDGGGGGSLPSVPFEIDTNLASIDTGKIDADYMESRFKRWMKALGQKNVSEDEVDDFLNDLHQTFATLSAEDQQLAEVIVHDIQGGDLQLAQGDTFVDCLNRYRRRNEDERVLAVVDAFGVDLGLLTELMQLATTGKDPNSHGRLDALKRTIDDSKAKAYLERVAGRPLRPRIIAREATVLLTQFVEDGGFDLEERAKQRLA